MGWWKVQGTELLLGDEPLDVLHRATRAVLDSYRREFARKPTRAEWESLLTHALHPIELADVAEPRHEESMFAEGGRPTSVAITIKPGELKEPDISKVARTCQQIAVEYGFDITIGQSDAFVRELLFGKFDLWASLDEQLISRDEFLSAILVRFLDWARARANQPAESISRDAYENELTKLHAAIFEA